MAFVDDQQDPNNPQTADDAGASSGGTEQQPQTSGGTSSNSISSSPASASPQGVSAVPGTSKAPPVQNLQAYLTANAPQALGMGQKIAGQLEGGYQAVNKDIGNAQQQFEGEVAQSAAPANASDIVSQAAKDPTQFVRDANNVSQFKKVQNANYTGPSNFEGSNYYQNLNSEIQNAQKQAPDISNPANIQQLVRGQERNPTAGQSNLDTLLLQQSPGGVAAIKAATAPYATLGDTLKNLTSTQNQKITDTKAGVTSAQQLVPNAFLNGPNAVVPAYQQGLQAQLAQAQQGATNYNNNINQNIQKLNPFEAQLQKYINTSGVNIEDPLTKFLSQEPLVNAPNLGNVSSSDDYAKNAALEQLLGTGYSPLLTDANAGQAGTFKVPDSLTPDLTQLSGDVAHSATRGQAGKTPIDPRGIYPGKLTGADPNTVPNLSYLLGTGSTLQGNGTSNIPQEYETLLNYLQTVNPDKFSKTYNQNNYVNS